MGIGLGNYDLTVNGRRRRNDIFRLWSKRISQTQNLPPSQEIWASWNLSHHTKLQSILTLWRFFQFRLKIYFFHLILRFVKLSPKRFLPKVILNICCFTKIGLRKWNFFGVMNFDLKNDFKNEFKDNNEKSCSWYRNRVSQKIDFKAIWPRIAMPPAWELSSLLFSFIFTVLEQKYDIIYIAICKDYIFRNSRYFKLIKSLRNLVLNSMSWPGLFFLIQF